MEMCSVLRYLNVLMTMIIVYKTRILIVVKSPTDERAHREAFHQQMIVAVRFPRQVQVVYT